MGDLGFSRLSPGEERKAFLAGYRDELKCLCLGGWAHPPHSLTLGVLKGTGPGVEEESWG